MILERIEFVQVTGPQRLTVRLIRDTVAAFYSLTPKDFRSRVRSHWISHPRQAAMYLARKLTNSSYPQIGTLFGGFDHTSVMHAVRAIEARRLKSKELDDDLIRLETEFRKIEAKPPSGDTPSDHRDAVLFRIYAGDGI